MPAARTRDDLIAVTCKEWDKLSALLDRVPPAARLAPDAEAEETTIKDIVGHRAEWITLFLGWYDARLAGKPVEIPAPGYKWNQLKAFNADLRARQADLDWDAACALLRKNHARLLRRLKGLDDAALYGAPMVGGGNAWPPGRWVEAAGPSHDRSAAKYIRQRLRALAADDTV